jgi:glycyl-tRNA synthetase beta chain
MIDTQDMLFEIGTEELPPGSLQRMRESLHASIDRLLDDQHLPHGPVHSYATPRRLAVLVEAVQVRQPDRDVTRRGPAITAAFDKDGKPTRPATGFAQSCGVSIEDLERLETDKGAWLVHYTKETGKPATEVLPGLIEQALRMLPVARRMRWGSSRFEFVRPVHWILLLLGNSPVTGEILGTAADRYTRGHRFHHNERIAITSPSTYVETLEKTGHVMVD